MGSTRRDTSMKKKKTISIPGVGTAVQLSNGTIEISFNDGSQLLIDGKNPIRYQYPDGTVITRNIPYQIKDKLAYMQKFLNHFSPSGYSHKILSMR